MATDFRLFGPAHLAILAGVPLAAMLLGRLIRRGGTAIPRALGLVLMANELVWYAWRLRQEGFRFPEGLPLQLCDLVLWVTVAACLTRNQWLYELSFFGGLGGSSMAILTPDLWAPFCSYPTIYFFAAHGLVVASPLALTLGGMLRPRPGCVWRALALVNGWALVVGAFNAVYSTNYMYLCRKPPSASLLDWMGPWPWYILAGEAVAVVLFSLFWLPFFLADARTAQRAA